MTHLQGALAVRVFLCFASAYFLSYAFRAVNAVIAPDLLNDVGLQNADLGLLSSAYFLSFAALQLPLGIWLDKYGPRKTEAALLMFAAAGAALFAMSTSLAGLWIGRALIGVGVSACLMASFKAYRQWFPADRQAQLASWMLVAGTSGALAATVPVNAALPFIGWRGVFWVMCGMILASATAIFFLLRKAEAALPPPPAHASTSSGTSGYAEVFSNRFFRRVGLLGAVNHGSFVALQTLWAGPWMTTVLGMSKEQTASILFLINLCLLLAYLVLAWWAPRHVSHDGSRGFPVIRVITVGVAGMVIAQVAMLLTSAAWSWVLWIVLAVCVTVGTLAQTSMSLSFPTTLAGRANTAFNLLLFVGAFAVQWGIGLLIDVFTAYGATPADAMRGAFAICLAAQVASLAAFILDRAQPRIA
ncbi:MAG TPA: MFS transporter [Noviherbaspirillum sp.]